MSTSEKGLAVIRSFEGRALKAYKDCVGVWTIGYGQTNYDSSVLGF
jgi:lysozyme